MNPDKLLTLLMGKQWHIAKEVRRNGYTAYECPVCGLTWDWRDPQGCLRNNPSFSDPRHRDEFFTWLTKERPAMWEAFFWWCWELSPKASQALRDQFVSWLFFSDPARPRDLMAEWLRLDSTIRDFGWEECPNFNPNPEDVNCLNWNESCFCKSGKIRAEWAR